MTSTDPLTRLYERATGTAVTPRSAEALARFGPYLLGMGAAKGISTIGQLLISRALGPAEFGRVAIVLSTASLLALPLAGAWGSTFVRYTAGQPRATWAPLLRWAAHRTLGTVALLAAAVALGAPVIARLVSVPTALIVAGAALSVALALWLLAKASCQGRENWAGFVGVELAWGIAVLAGLGLMAGGGRFTWLAAAAVFAAAYGLGAVAAAPYFRAAASAARLPADPAAERYGRFALLTGTSNTVLLVADRFAAQYALGFSEVGIYHVYSFATVGVAMLLSTVLNNFAFPLFPQGDRRAFAAIFRTAFVRLLPLTLAALLAIAAIQVYLARFPLRPALLAVAALNAAAFIRAAFFGNLVLSHGVGGSKVAARVSGASVAAFALAVVPAVRLGGLVGLFLLYTAIFLGVSAYYQRALDRLET